MTSHEIIRGVMQKEGGFRARVQRPDGTWDPDTMYGVTLPTFERWRMKIGLPVPTLPDLKKLTPGEAEKILDMLYVQEPGFTAEAIPFEPLRVQLIDFGVNSGPERAVRWLQRVLGVGVTGRMDRATTTCLHGLNSGEWWTAATGPTTTAYNNPLRLVNDALVAARAYMIDQAVDQGSMRKQDEEGVESRALSFFLARP